MFDPLDYPFQRVNGGAGYADGQVVEADTFYNPTQDHLARVYGGVLGRSGSIRTEEFDLESAAFAGTGDRFGEQLLVIAASATNARAASATPIGAGDHGIWKAEAVANGAYEFRAYDADKYIDTRQFFWSARVRFVGRANFETVANEGFGLGLRSVAGGGPLFYFGNDVADWQTYADGVGVNHVGTTADDDVWHTLIITRRFDNNVRFYYQRQGGALTLLRTVAWGASLTGCRRYVSVKGTGGAAAGEGFFIDYYKCGVER